MVKFITECLTYLFEDADDDPAEAAFVEAEVGVSFQGKKCSEKGLASEINTSKVCLQTTAEAPGCMEIVEVICPCLPPLVLPPLPPRSMFTLKIITIVISRATTINNDMIIHQFDF